MIRIRNLPVPLEYDDALLRSLVSSRLGVSPDDVQKVSIRSRETFTTSSDDVCFRMILDVRLNVREEDYVWGRRDRDLSIEEEDPVISFPAVTEFPIRPIVVGSGPAGLFAALLLAKAGARPILMERGCDIDTRDEAVRRFLSGRRLDVESNIPFGAGGAGTYSDGKLKTGQIDPEKKFILDTFIEAGAPEDILYDKLPHIGTDILHNVVKNILAAIVSLGGEVLYRTKLLRVQTEGSHIRSIVYSTPEGKRELAARIVVLAIGHSARDTVQTLYADGVRMEAKPFGVGVRIEHPQSLIDRIQYGKAAGHKSLGAASYRMVVRRPDGRGVYTFCMCPGGSVVPATSEEGCVVTNGMSLRARSGPNANAALLVSVTAEDIRDEHPLAGMTYQRQIERAAYAAGGGGFFAPAQRLEDFLSDRRTTAFGEVEPSYQPGVHPAELREYLPQPIVDSLRAALREMGDWMPGYLFPDAVLTGAETRTTSPVRMIRDESMQAYGIKGLYPCGEGAGYAGGIISAAVDGLRAAGKIIDLYALR